MHNDQDAPVWARSEAFPLKPESGAFGFIDLKGNQVAADSIESLAETVSKSREGVDLVWSPAHAHLVAPEELAGLRKVLWERRRTWAQRDISDGQRMSLLFGAVVLWALYYAWQRFGGELSRVLEYPFLGIASVMLLMFGLVPWYEGWKVLRKGKLESEADIEADVADSRFDAWLSSQKVPFTYALLVMMVLIGGLQFWLEGGVSWMNASVQRGGLLKQSAHLPGGEWWRYFTAPLLHGHVVHWVMNAAALRYLGRRMELLMRWPHLLIVFFFSAWIGGLTTAYFAPATPSVGASGGILGLLGCLIVFETMHKRLVPVPSRRRLLAGVILIAAMGALGVSFIDNAAHAGGLFAGMFYGWLVFPASKSALRPAIEKRDLIAGAGAGVVLLLATLFTCYKLLA